MQSVLKVKVYLQICLLASWRMTAVGITRKRKKQKERTRGKSLTRCPVCEYASTNSSNARATPSSSHTERRRARPNTAHSRRNRSWWDAWMIRHRETDMKNFDQVFTSHSFGRRLHFTRSVQCHTRPQRLQYIKAGSQSVWGRGWHYSLFSLSSHERTKIYNVSARL